MKDFIKRFFFIVTMSLISTSCFSQTYEETAERVTAFYKQYISAILFSSDRDEWYNVREKNITPGALEMIYNFSASTGADPITRAQDVNETMLATVKTVHLEDDWYEVSWCWVEKDPSPSRVIPLKAKIIDGKFQITYTPHPSTDSPCNDDMLRFPTRTKESEISQQSAMEFLSSFYDVYLSHYCLMDLNLIENIKKLRDKYLTDNAKAQFKKVEDEYLYDHVSGFDLLINEFYFDPMWYKSLKVMHVGGDNYRVTFKAPKKEPTFDIVVLKTDNGYVIDSIVAKSNYL